MSIEWLRDLVICIYGIVGVIVLIFISVICFMLYRKAQNVMNSVKSTTENVNNVIATVKEEFISPVLEITAMFQGIKQIAALISGIFKKSGKEKHER
ncbi:MAG TPA: hypothetical protein VJ488_05965 [Dehalococcoidia bacterium]|nr:hypothetical protein [Dehalococcoidia bacterium]